MDSTISNLIFPKPSAPTYGLGIEQPDARLIHIRRRLTKKFTFAYYVSQAFLPNDMPTGPSANNNSSSRNGSHRYLVIYAHPNAVDIGGMLDEASVLSKEANVDVLLWEFRGYGLCEGAASERELYLDIEAVFDFAETELGIPSHQIIVMGRSIGAGPSVQLAACLPTILNGRRLSSLRRANEAADAARSPPMYRFPNVSPPGQDGEPLRLPIAGLFLQCAFTSISDAVDSLIDAYSSSGVLAYTKGMTKSIAKRVVAERFRSVDAIADVFCFETEFLSVGTAEGGANQSTSTNGPEDNMSLSATQNKNQIALAKRVWADTVGNYLIPPFLSIQHGDDDTIVPHSHAIGLMKAIDTRCSQQDADAESAATSLSSTTAGISSRYKAIHRGESLAKLHTATGYGHNNLNIHEAAEILTRDIIAKHTLVIDRLMGAYRHNEQFLKLLNFPDPSFVDLDAVVKNTVLRFEVAEDPYFQCIYHNEFSTYNREKGDVEGIRLEKGTQLRHMKNYGEGATAADAQPDQEQEELPGVASLAFDLSGHIFRQQQREMRLQLQYPQNIQKGDPKSDFSMKDDNQAKVQDNVTEGFDTSPPVVPASPSAPATPAPLVGLADTDKGINEPTASSSSGSPLNTHQQEDLPEAGDVAASLPPMYRPTLSYWSSRILRNYTRPIGTVLLSIAEPAGSAREYFSTRANQKGHASVSKDMHQPLSAISPIIPAVLTSSYLQKELAALLEVSVSAFAQHVATRWLRMQAKRSIVQLRQRGAKTAAYGYGWGGSGGGVMSTALAGGESPHSAIGAGNTSPDSVHQTALPPVQTPREFIYEHLSLFGSPFGVYLQPRVLGADSNMHSGLATEAGNSKTSQPPSDSYQSSGFHAVIFGSFVPDPASLTAAEVASEHLSESGGAMMSTATPFKCWYTHTVGNSDGSSNKVSYGESAGPEEDNVRQQASISTTARRMKRMGERFPRVTLAEFEIPENILVTLERFVGTLDYKAALADAPAATSSNPTQAPQSMWPSRRSHQSGGSGEHFTEDGGERHIDDLCGALSVGNSLLMLSEGDANRIQIECERLIIALTQRELAAMAELASLTCTEEGSASATNRDRLTKAMPLSTLVVPFIQLLGTDPSTLAATGGDDEESYAEEGFLVPLLYGPSAFNDARIALPPTIIVRLYKSFSSEFYNTTGDLSSVLQDVKRRRLWFEQNHPMYRRGAASTPAALVALEECLDGCVFDLQSALLRNVPEGFCGSVGCGRYRDADEAVCLLQEIYLKTFVEAETYKLPFSPIAGEGLKTLSAVSAVEAKDEAEGSDVGMVEGLSGNCRFVASLVGGSDAQRRHVLLGRAEDADSATRDALHWIMPPSNLSAAATDSNNDCCVM